MSPNRKEPIKKIWLWVVFAILITLITPWYFPAGDYQPLIGGVPYWALIVIGASLALSLFLHYVIRCQWRIEEDNEAGTGE